MKGNAVKILLVGARYTGKGQVGRAWGRTDADLPALQPVILYDRMVDDRRVVAWVMSYDPEFQDIRTCFLKDADGLVLTFNVETGNATTLDALGPLLDEYSRMAGEIPPAALFGVKLDPAATIDQHVLDDARVLAEKFGFLGPWAGDHTDAERFQEAVDRCFHALLERVPCGKK